MDTEMLKEMAISIIVIPFFSWGTRTLWMLLLFMLLLLFVVVLVVLVLFCALFFLFFGILVVGLKLSLLLERPSWMAAASYA